VGIDRVRRLLFWALLGGILGIGIELLLLEHFEMPNQLIPLILLGLSVPVLVWYRLRSDSSARWVIQAMMGLFILAGCIGVGLHYWGNREFELETYRSLAGVALFEKSMTGATPVLAPGSMVLLGLIGLAYTLGE
jgi:hypothetical protein